MIIPKGIQSPCTKTGPCTGKKFLVTGGSRGLGKAIVAELYKQGTVVYALARNQEHLETFKNEFPAVTTICVDIADWEETRKILEDLEPLDCLINNAGVCKTVSFMELTKDDYDRMYQVNLRAMVNVSQMVAKKMIENGKGGSIVNVSSIGGRVALPSAVGYSSIKAGVEMLTKAMAVELGPHQITVNSVCPSVLGTDMFFENNKNANLDKVLGYIESKTPTGAGFIPLEDVVQSILFFGSKVAPQVTGESLLVDGGMAVTF